MSDVSIGDSVRTHDSLYLNNVVRVKEYFKFIVAEAGEVLATDKPLRILDVGCATGDFLRYLDSLYPQHEYSGLEFMPELIAKAKEFEPKFSYAQGDIQKGLLDEYSPFDCVFMNGVNGMFDDCNAWLENIVKLVKQGGHAYIFGPFNPYDVDVVVRVRKSGYSGPYENGWNTISRNSVLMELKKLGVDAAAFLDFKMPFKIETRSDPMRSWTVDTSDGDRLVINGAGLIRPQALLTFQIS